MKAFKKISLFALSAVLLMGCAACTVDQNDNNEGGDDPEVPRQEFVDPNTVVKTYDNRAYNEYLLGDDVAIANQWSGYGIGDPFVMRWNGRYYLYCSTLDSEIGVRGYTSVDLVNWVPMTGSGLKTGYVSEDNITLAAYAPEVYYFNGTFYMYTSPGGGGHYILTATSPEGPFTRVTENFGLSIDGSVLIDDDEQMYFTYAGDAGIHIAKMTDMLNVDMSSLPTLNGTSIGGWTEGSYILKRGGTYYLTYTGNNVASDGYRIAYATAESITTAAGGLNRNAFTRAQNNPLALETESALKGIGHSSTVMGPDMDSHYLVYHYLNSSGGPNRSLGIDRLTFNGSMMSVATTLEGSVAPTLPVFYAEGRDEEKLTVAGDFLLSDKEAPAAFTAEFNVKGSGKTTYVFGYTNESNYLDVTVDFAEKTVVLSRTVNGSASVVASGTLVHDFAAADLHTVRISSRDGLVDVAFDNMTKIAGAQVNVTAGKLGYKSLAEGAELGFTGFSDVAMGMSDQREAKQISSYIGASEYLYDDVYTLGNRLGNASAVSVIEDDVRLAGWKSLTLGENGDFASYLVYNPTAGRYGLELVYRTQDGGKKVGVKIDGASGGTVWRCTLPKVASDDDYVKALIGEFELTAGAHTVRIESLGEAVNFAAFSFVETANVAPMYEQSLADYAETGADYKTIWKIRDEGHYAKAGTRQLVYFGDNTITDFTLEVEVKLDGATGTSTAGIVFRAQNYAASSFDSYRSIQGYYLAINNNQVVLQRLNYADGSTDVGTWSQGANSVVSDTFVTLKIVARGNAFTVSLGGNEILSVTDGWGYANGKIGLYTNGAAVIFKNLKISG